MAFSLAAIACDPSTGTPAPASPTARLASPTGTAAPPTDSPEAVYRRIEEQVSAIRGLATTKAVTPQFVTKAELGTVLARILEEDTPPEELRKAELLYRTLGLMTGEPTLEELFLDLLQSQVAGLYDARTEALYVLSKSGGVGPVEQVFFAHEFEHALQDQHFDLEALQDLPLDQGDRILAHQALVEGDAYALMAQWLFAHLGAAGIGALLEASNDPAAKAALDAIPEIVQAQILFPATQGTVFVQGLQLAGGWAAVDAAFADPPRSTEQILHPEKYAAREAPIEVSVPADPAGGMGDGWREVLRDTLGEHQLEIWLDAPGAGGPGPASAATAAVGWGGDRLILFESSTAAAAAFVTEWDSQADAVEFAEAAQRALDARGLIGGVLQQPGSTTVTVLIATTDAAATRLDLVFGITGV